MYQLGLSVWFPAVHGRAGTPAEPSAPVLTAGSPLVTDNGDGTGTLAFTTDIDCTARVWIGPTGTTPTAQEVWDGTGADGTIEQAITAAGSTYSPTLPEGLSGDYRLSVVARVGDGPLSNVLTQSPVAFDTVVASNPTVIGTQAYSVDSATPTVPLPTGKAEGQTAFVVIMWGTNQSVTVTPPAGYTSRQRFNISTDTVMEVFSGTVPAGAANPTFTLSALVAVTAFSVITDGTTIGTPVTGQANGVTGQTCSALTVSAGDLALTFIGVGNRAAALSATPALTAISAPDGKTNHRTIGLVAVAGEAAGTATGVSFTHNLSSSAYLRVGIGA